MIQYNELNFLLPIYIYIGKREAVSVLGFAKLSKRESLSNKDG